MHWPTPPIAAVARSDRRQFLVPAALASVGMGHLSGGAWLLWQHHAAVQRLAWGATYAVLLLLLGIAQLLMARAAWRKRHAFDPAALLRRRLFWRWLLVGFVICYGVAVLVGAERAGLQLFWIAMALWLVLAQLPLVADGLLLTRVLRWQQLRLVRVFGWTIYAAVVLPLAAELTARIYAVAFDDPLSCTYAANNLKLAPGSLIAGRRVNAQGYWDKEFHRQTQPGVFRVAAIGDDLTLWGETQATFLAQLERRLAGVEIYNFGLPGAGPKEYAAVAAHEIAPYHPDLVLAFLSVADDITQQSPPPGLFDWRGLHLYRAGTLWLGQPDPLEAALSVASCRRERSDYLSDTVSQLSVCRTPIDEPIRQCWRNALGHLDTMVHECRRQGIAVALVVAPGRFQVDRLLCDVVQRRAGYGADQIDLGLPQRRLAVYAQQRDLPMLDLLPHLTSSRQPPFAPNCSALSASGSELTAEIVGQWVQSRFGSLIATADHSRR